MMRKKTHFTFQYFMLVLLAAPLLYAFPRAMILQGIQGPWELTVSLGGQDAGNVFPIEVTNEDARQTLNKTFPVLGSPLRVKVLEYCPDLKWKTIVAEDPNGGPVLSMTVAGKDASQEVVLLADVPQRRSVTASIGSLAVRRIYHTDLLKDIGNKKAAGVLVFWTDPAMPPQEYVVKPGDSFPVPGTPYTADILEYMPHYSIDKETKEVKNYSEQPTNPALKVRLSDGQNTCEQWVWSNFGAFPHAMSKFPIRVEFSDFDTGPSENRYFIVIAGQSERWLYSMNSGDIRLEPMKLNHPYPFKDEAYTFTLDSVLAHGVLVRKWENNSEKLQHPAMVVSVESDKTAQEAVVELNQPMDVKTAYGTLVLYYRQKAETKQPGTQE